MLVYLRPFADLKLSPVARLSYTMANWGWVVGMLIWALLSYVMIGWIIFQVSHLKQLLQLFSCAKQPTWV